MSSSARISLREQKARSILKQWRVDSPSAEDWAEALLLADNIATRERIGAREHIGAYGLAKQDLLPYKPVLAVGPPSREPDSSTAKGDDLLEWLLKQPNVYRKG